MLHGHSWCHRFLFFLFSNPVQSFRESKGGTFSIFLAIKRQTDFVDLVAVSWRNYDLVDFVPAYPNTVRQKEIRGEFTPQWGTEKSFKKPSSRSILTQFNRKRSFSLMHLCHWWPQGSLSLCLAKHPWTVWTLPLPFLHLLQHTTH